MDTPASSTTLPSFFKTILWSYDFAALDPEKDKETIIDQSINYGDLTHWRWLVAHYGKAVIQEALELIPASEFRPAALRLVTILFQEHISIKRPEVLTNQARQLVLSF